jgi:uncharacterized protein (TIGR02284 family)
MAPNDIMTKDADALDRSAGYVLRNLSAHCQDSTLGYRRAAEDTSDEYFAGEFEELSDERQRMTDELVDCLRRVDEPTTATDTAVGRVHRLWMDFVSIVSRGDRQQILREVLRGESALEQAYDDALRTDLPDDIREIVKRQHRSVKRTRNRFRQLLQVDDQTGPIGERINLFTQPIWEHPYVAFLGGAILACVIGAFIAGNDRRGR